MGLGAVDLWVGERNKNTEFGMGPWTAVRRKLQGNGVGCCWLMGLGNKKKHWHRVGSLDCSEKEARGVIELGAVDSWVGETNKKLEFRLDAWTAVRRKLVESSVWVLLTYGSGTQIKAMSSG